jgi:hypothetical protein
MFTSRTHTFLIKNDSLITMHYSLKIINPLLGTEITDNGYFRASPSYGEVLAGNTEEIRIRFSPTETDNNLTRYLIVNIENLDPA